LDLKICDFGPQVRKRPINKKELARKEEDIITIKDTDCSLTVHEPKVKVYVYSDLVDSRDFPMPPL
jgi:hypothetical protein